jgi:hypothetical protein
LNTKYSRNIREENREETYKRQFEERQLDYKAMTTPPTLPKVNFTMSEDTVIPNMAELVEKQRQLRELDIQPYQQQYTEKLKLQEDLPRDIIQLDTIPLDNYSVGIQTKVKWSDHDDIITTTHEENSIVIQEITELKNEIRRMGQVLSQFIDKVNHNIHQDNDIIEKQTQEIGSQTEDENVNIV